MSNESHISLPTELVALLRDARRIAVLTGAGVSAESGIPTFRDALTGYWSKFRPEELATPEAFAADPAKVARWYDERRRLCLACEPNAGHRALAAMQRHARAGGRRFELITQNIDRLHQAAGGDDVIELHGTLLAWRCTACGESCEERGPAFETYPPACVACGQARRPSVVWFGEVLPAEALQRAAEAAMACDVFLSIGTSGVVYPAAGLIDAALAGGARVVEINVEPTANSARYDFSIQGPAGVVLPMLAREMGVESEV